jgi:hypothetical protein
MNSALSQTRGPKEIDVREEIAVPLLALLGYRRGTENDIQREVHLAYGRNFLGRKKKSDRPLRGSADYVLGVTGAGRWILELKSSLEDITVDAIDQAISYARHPEISGTYAVVLNGVRLVVYHNTQRSTDQPLVDLAVQSPEALAAQLEGLLSPAAIRRDCSPPIVDLKTPLASGLRSRAHIRSGTLSYSDFTWHSNIRLPNAHVMDDLCQRMRSWRSHINGGQIWRDDTSRIIAKLQWTAPHDEMLRLAQDKGLMDIEYVSLSYQISDDPDNPTVFDAVARVSVKPGETLFDIRRWETQVVGAAAVMAYRGQAVGFIEGQTFCGLFRADYEMTFPAAPMLLVNMSGVGEFRIAIDIA